MTRVSAVTRAPLAVRQVESGSWGPEYPHLWVSHIPRAVDFYLAIGCEVRLAADGWVQLRQAEARFALIQGHDARDAFSVVLSLTSPDLTELRGRLGALGIEAGPIICSAGAHSGRIQLRDPDLHKVEISHVVLAPASDTRSPKRAGLTHSADRR